MERPPERLTKEFLIKNKEYDIGSTFNHWRAWVWKQIVLMEVSGDWKVTDCTHYSMEFWDLFCERKKHWDVVYFLIDTHGMDIQNEAFRQYLKESWGHLLDREGLRLCIVEPKAMKRLIWSSVFRLLNKQDRVPIFKNHSDALAWILGRCVKNGV